MFGLFRSKKKIKKNSRIGITREAAFSHLANELKSHAETTLVFYFFEESRETFERLLQKEFSKTGQVKFVNAKKINAPSLSSTNVIYCLDHYPLSYVFKNFSEKISELNPDTELIVYGGLDEPIFNQFGGERIKDLMIKLGMTENEMISHSLVSKSIENAQEKIEKKVITESLTQSSAEWFKRNLPEKL